MYKLIVIILHSILKPFYQSLHLIYSLTATLDLGQINPILLFGQLFLLEFYCHLEKCLEFLLCDLPVFFVLESFVGGEMVVCEEIWISDLIDDIFAGKIERCAQLCLHLVEIVVDRLLQQSTFGFYRIFKRKFLDSILNLILIQ